MAFFESRSYPEDNPHIVIDLLPIRSDGSNGGNLLFILNLIARLRDFSKDQLLIICPKDSEEFIRDSFDRVSYEEKFNPQITYVEGYSDASKIINKWKKESYYHYFKNNLLHNKKIFLQRNIVGYYLNSLRVKISRIDILIRNVRSNLLTKLFSKILFIASAILLRVINLLSVGTCSSIKNKNQLIYRRDIASTTLNSILFTPFGHFDIAGLKFRRVVSIIYDLQHMDMPFMHSEQQILIRNFHYLNILNNSCKVITISNYSKKQILHHFEVEDGNVDVIHLPSQFIENENVNKKKLSINRELSTFLKYKKNFFFTPANYWEHKNHKTLLVAINMFTRRNKDINFIFSGKFLDSVARKEFDDFLKVNKLNKRVLMLDYIESDLVEYLYSKCCAVITPSLYEGFGMTLREAYYFRKVAIASNIEAHKEIGDPDTTIFFDPRSPKDILDKLLFFSKQNIENFSFNRIVNIEKIYQDYVDAIVGVK